jgi:hypothetical protein
MRQSDASDLSKWANIVSDIPSVAEVSIDEFHARQGTPFVIRHTRKSAAEVEQWSPSSVRRIAGNAVVPVYVSADGTFPGGQGPYNESKYRECRMSVSELLDRWSNAPMAPLLVPGERYYLYQLPADELDMLAHEFPDPPYVEAVNHGSTFVLRNIWISNSGNITPIHYDVAENLLVQVFGTKRILVWNPAQYAMLYLNPLGTTHDRQSRLDVFQHNPTDYPMFERAGAWTCMLEPGDMLYLPAFWPHYVRTMEISMSVNYWWPLPETLTLLAKIDSRSLSEDAFRGVVAEVFEYKPDLIVFWDQVVSESGIDAVMRFTAQYRI